MQAPKKSEILGASRVLEPQVTCQAHSQIQSQLTGSQALSHNLFHWAFLTCHPLSH